MASLFKRGDIWYGRHVKYIEGKRKDEVKSFKTKDEKLAKNRLARWEAQLVAKKWKETFDVTFHEAAQLFLNEHCLTLKPASVKRYRTNLQHLRPFFADKELADISRSDILAFENMRRKDKVTTGTIRGDITCLGSIFSYAMTKEWVEVNPVPAFLKARRKVLKPSPPRTRYLSHEEESRLLAACKAVSGGDQHKRDMLYAAVVMALDTGLRLEELFSLKWTECQVAEPAYVDVLETKSGKPRRVPLLDRVSNVASRIPVHPSSPYVFWNKGGKRDGMRFCSMKKGFAAAVERAGLKDVVFHDLRRTRGCRMLQDEGASMVEVKEWLGHSSVTVTERHYAFLKRDALNRFVTQDRERRAAKPSAEILQLRRTA